MKKDSDLDGHPIEGSIWENYVFMELIKSGNYKIGYNLFYYRDQNGVEIDFLIEQGKKIQLMEAKKAERPNESKLNFKKVAPLFPKYEVENILACTNPEKRYMKFKEYNVWNPMYIDLVES
ncbi:MAG: DUF4143 domain-containing protein [Leptospiraceae bacterium]|nr:DUF4143 domain-containing protein [Leptospiraceae bacterium]